MKKLLLFLITITLTMVLTACGSKKEYLGLWKYDMKGSEYSVELFNDNTWKMKQGTAEREGTYTVKAEENYLTIDLEYKNTHGYMKWQDNKMCAYTSSVDECDFYFERVNK